MGLIDIFFIGIGLSMDAFAVAICKGLKMKVIDLKQSLITAFFFGLFQAVMPLIGYSLSIHFVSYVDKFSHWIAFVLLLLIGMNMIREVITDKGDEDDTDCSGIINFKELILMAIATSIDALAVGVSLGTMSSNMEVGIITSAILIGCTTFIISIGGVFIGNLFGIRYKNKAEIAGGVILILIGTKIVLEHYGILF